MKLAKVIGDAQAAPTKADFRQLSSLEPGQIVRSLDGSAYRVKSKIAGPDGFVFKLANLQGKPVPTPADFRPVSLAMARFASWLKYHLAYRQDFDLYIKSYIEQYNSTHPDSQLPLEAIGPDGKPFRWARWFQSEIAPKLHVKQKGEAGDELKDEAIHEMLFTVMGQRHALDQFGTKIKNFGDVQKLEVARQLTVYLTSAFKFRVSEMQKKINKQAPTLGFELEEHLEDLMSELSAAKTKKQRESVQQRIDQTKAQLETLGEYKDSPREMSMYQPSQDEGDEGEFNVIEQEQYGVGEDDFTSAEAKRDIARFRTGFARWLEHTQGKKASGLVLLFDLYWVLVSNAGKDKPREDAERTKKEQKRDESAGYMISRGDLEKAWMGKTGLSFGAFKEYLGLLPGLIDQYINSHREAIGEENAIVGLMDKINQERGKSRPAHVSALNIAGVEGDIDEARAAVVSPMTVASEVQPDIAEAAAGSDSPGSVDQDIKHPVKSVPEAAKVADEVDHYDFPKNWKEDEMKEDPDADIAQESQAIHGKKVEMIRSIRPGDRVTILVPAGRGRNGVEWKESTGRAVMPSSHGGWVLNMGGAHGTPGVCDENNIVRVQKRKSSAEKIAQRLIPGNELTPDMRKQVLNAFIYRWTKDNPARVKTYLHYMGGECPKCDIRNPFVNAQSAEGHPHPTIPMIDDNQWIAEHAFSFTNDGRLVTRGEGRHAQPVYLAQHSEDRVASVQQKFAVLRAATADEQFSCCDGFESHKDNCSVKDTDSTSKHTAMIGHMFDDADGQAIRNDLAEDTGKDPQAFHTTEQRQPRMAAGTQDCCGAFKPKHKENCETYNDNFDRTTKALGLKEGAGSNSGNDDPRGAGDLWRETYYETQEGISPKAMMDGIKKDAQGSGSTTITMQEQNATIPNVPGKGQPMAVPEAIDQQAGPHSPNAPMTAPRTPGIQPKIVNVPPGTEADSMTVQSSADDSICRHCGSQRTEIEPTTAGYEVYCDDCEKTASMKTADLFDDDGSEPSIENDVPNMSEEQKGQWLEAHGWEKEKEHHGPTWWLGAQQWFKPGFEEEIPFQSTDDAVEKELEIQYKEEEADVMEGTCRECGAAINNAEGTICPACSAQGAEDQHDPLAEHVGASERVKLKCNECGKHFSVSPNAADPDCPKCGGVDWDVVDDGQPKQSADKPYATYDRLKKFHEEWGNKIFPDDQPKQEEEQHEDPHDKEGAAAAPAAPVVSPNVAQNMNIVRPPAVPGTPGATMAIMPGEEEEGAIKRHTVEPELPNAKYHMQGALDELVASEVEKLASGDAFEKLAGHFYTTVEGKGKNKAEAQRAAIDEFLYENGRRHSVYEVLDPKFIRKEPPMGVTYVERGVTHHDYTKPNTKAPEKDWVEVWEFNLHTHA
jgi:hypothetical protein